MNISKLLIVPDINSIDASIAVAKQYNCGFEYNDFFLPKVLDNEMLICEMIDKYKSQDGMPDYSTLHGAFLDITVFSSDSKILSASDYRVEQSLSIAKDIGAKAVVFHTNYIPNFMDEAYREGWLENNVSYWSNKAYKHPNINIYIENMFDVDYTLMQKLGERMKDIDNFGLCFDYAHACVFGDEEKIDEWCQCLGPYIKHVHINDNDFISDLHMALGKGKIDWNRFKKNYQMNFNQATILVEMNGIEKIRESLKYLSEL